MNFKPPEFLKRMFPQLIWNIDDPHSIYLTFDDGPHPVVTPWVLDQLDRYHAKATFFCLGKNVEQHPETFRMILERGHQVGNHTYSHQKGWGMSTSRYLEDVEYANQFIRSTLFRPPYARITPNQIRRLREHYRLILWSIVSRDYSKYVSGEQCLHNATIGIQPGSIIVFHDSLKSYANLKYALPRTLQYFHDKHWQLKSLDL